MEELDDLFREWLKSADKSRDKEEFKKINNLLQTVQTHLEDEINRQIQKEKNEAENVKQRLHQMKSGPDGKADTQLQGRSLVDIFDRMFQKRNCADSVLRREKKMDNSVLLKEDAQFLNTILKRAVTFCEAKVKEQRKEWTNTVMLVDSSTDNSIHLKNMEYFMEMQNNLSEYTVPQLWKQYKDKPLEDIKRENKHYIPDEVYRKKEVCEYIHACIELAWELAIQKQEHKLIWETTDKSVNFNEKQLFYFDSVKYEEDDELRVAKPALVSKSVIKQGLVNVIKGNKHPAIVN